MGDNIRRSRTLPELLFFLIPVASYFTVWKIIVKETKFEGLRASQRHQEAQQKYGEQHTKVPRQVPFFVFWVEAHSLGKMLSIFAAV